MSYPRPWRNKDTMRLVELLDQKKTHEGSRISAKSTRLLLRTTISTIITGHNLRKRNFAPQFHRPPVQTTRSDSVQCCSVYRARSIDKDRPQRGGGCGRFVHASQLDDGRDLLGRECVLCHSSTNSPHEHMPTATSPSACNSRTTWPAASDAIHR